MGDTETIGKVKEIKYQCLYCKELNVVPLCECGSWDYIELKTGVHIDQRAVPYEEDSNVFSSVPIEINVDGDIVKVVKFLEENKGVAFSAKKLSAEFGFGAGAREVQIRKAIREYVLVKRVPIIGTSKGLMWVKHPNQILSYVDKLDNHSDGIKRTRDAMMSIYNEIRGEKNV